MTFDELENFISVNSGNCIEFGTEDQAPSTEWIEKAEVALECRLPKSFLWFLERFGGGKVNGDEIFFQSIKYRLTKPLGGCRPSYAK